MSRLTIGNLSITVAARDTERICYVLYPFSNLDEWAAAAARKFGVSLVVITGMDWNNDLTPWPAKGEPPGSPDFKGNASKFLSYLKDVVNETERRLGISNNAERTLAGVSLSGLFTLWQWMVCDTFHNIISLSGSFWYDGFGRWIKALPVPKRTGRAYFLLGDEESGTKVKAFQPVQTDTEEIVAYLRDNGINDYFELLPGNHYQYGLQRLDRAMSWMFEGTNTPG